jgi:peptide/nickel transport system permease protein
MLVFVSAITFVLLANAGGDAFSALRENPQVSAATIDRLRETYGLERPVIERYIKWLGGFVSGDLGESFHYRLGVGGIVFSRLWNTVLLGAAGTVIAWIIAILLTYFAAVTRSRLLGRVIGAIVLLTASIPRIVLALFALAIFVWSSGSAFEIQNGTVGSFVVGSLVMAIPLVALFLAQAHGEMKSAMKEESIGLARAKGLGESTIIARHASRFTLNPLLTISGLALGEIVSGSVIVETVLGWPGVGALMVSAVFARDVPLVMGIVVLATLAVWFGNALAEVLQLVNDRRLRDAEMVS